MRLAHIKLAGFKSFVDPTHIPVLSSLVGVVGPNGCGKSNVIDAVRWVLGESSAKNLRGETMQDVIFNGSSGRKAVGRASVELIFDNSLGKASGPWSRYAEISVKRVLERNGESDYYINNQHVRRRDVADMFLGTGLGGRAYAIIEQGMISRIIEARPEELRSFLEEAAGVSKYRERRKETESRLADTRENLARVSDIVQELARNLEHLEAQAEVAAKFRALEAELKSTQHLLWYSRKQEAVQQRARYLRDLDQTSTELEAEMARIRELERMLESAHQEYIAGSDRLQQAQGGLYEANAAVARLEQGLEHLRESRRRLQGQLDRAQAERAQAEERKATIESGLGEQSLALESAGREAAEAQERAEHAGNALPAAEQQHASKREALDEAQEQLALAQRELGVERTRLTHAERVMEQVRQRRTRLSEERAGLQQPDPRVLEELKAKLESRGEALRRDREALAAIDAQLPMLDQAVKSAAQSLETEEREIGAQDARRQALELLQRQVSRSGEMHAWLDQQQLDGMSRLWEGLSIRPGWEDALEAVLRERLNGIALEQLGRAQDWLQHPPPGKVSFFERQQRIAPDEPWQGHATLLSRLEIRDQALGAVLADWLGQVYMVDSASEGFRRRADLPAGARLVCPEGHVFTSSSVSFHAEDSEVHGILARQHEIEALQTRRETIARSVEAGKHRKEEALLALETSRRNQQAARDRRDETQRSQHAAELEWVRASEQADRIHQRFRQIEAELSRLEDEQTREQGLRADALGAVARLENQEDAAQSRLAESREEYDEAAEQLRRTREAHSSALRALQERQFSKRVIEQKLQDLRAAREQVSSGLENLTALLASVQGEMQTLDESALMRELQSALALKARREAALSGLRREAEEKESVRRELDRERMSTQQRLAPLQERAGELKLKEQEARLAQENFSSQLEESGANEEELAPRLVKGVRASALQGSIAQLTSEIAALGAVNLAALEELESSRTRKNYLDEQSRDLTEAIDTLEDAIRKIDRETRERLRNTFEAVNRHFGEMFPQLFGGGEAQLLMTGEEILDCGLQVIARPPGKRNASIHLLSGGEKALTAIALVFSLFQLNPAPFCLLDEVDAPLDDTNTERFCKLVQRISEQTQFLYISHNKITMEMAHHLVGVTMPEQGVSRIVAVDVGEAVRMRSEVAA
ncbi:MAG: chromosome segregation protein SMC [Betaproteobacteria bacterium]|nr:chromosome segregation protein SMC [Betaproteobacteria bacterium]